jgi:hypothetical protein
MLKRRCDDSVNSGRLWVNRGSNHCNSRDVAHWCKRRSQQDDRRTSLIHICHLDRAPRRLLEGVPAPLDGVVGLCRQTDVNLAAGQPLLETRYGETNRRIVEDGLAPEIDPAPGGIPG